VGGLEEEIIGRRDKREEVFFKLFELPEKVVAF